MTDGTSRVAEQAADDADTRISGDTRAWVSAFSPGGNTNSLQISGDRQLAEHMLGQLARTEMREMEGIDRAVA
jgi:hypothetical protein